MPRPTVGERGSVTPLLLGFALLLLVGIAMVVDSSAVYIQRQGLGNVADGAAIQGADAGAQVVHRLGIPSGRLPQLRGEVLRAVRAHLISSGARADFPGIRATVTLDAAARSVRVTVSAPVDLPLRLPGVSSRVTVTAHSAAAVQVRR